jgi:FixJ family two-component response regulator
MQAMQSKIPGLSFVIIMSNHRTDLAVEAMKKGALDFISKPFFTEDLLRSIDYVSRKKDLDRQREEHRSSLELRVKEKTVDVRHGKFPR